MQDFVGYKQNTIGFGEATLATGGTAAPITLAIDAAMAVIAAAPLLSQWIQGWWAAPAHHTRSFLSSFYPTIINKDPNERIAYVIAAAEKGPAKDVIATELLDWYRLTYPTDYTILTKENKQYWNTYVTDFANKYKDSNNAYADALKSKFTDTEINYTATPLQSITNLFSSSSTGGTNWLMYAAIGLGIYLIIKK